MGRVSAGAGVEQVVSHESASTGRARRGPRPLRRRSSFRVLAMCMTGLGITMGLVFPPFVAVIGVATWTATGSLRFRLSCLLAGLLVGGANYLLVRVVVGRRLRHLAAQMRDAGQIVSTATASGDWSVFQVSGCHVPVDSDDELGEPAEAFNSLLLALESSVTARERLEARLRHQAFHDPLTGLANRALFLDHAANALARSRRNGSHLAVLYLDLDRFKPINDDLGHAAGDSVLIETAARLRAVCRSGDTVARLGGDEFALLVEDLDPAGTTALAQRLATSVAQPSQVDGRDVRVAASVGVTFADATIHTPDDLLRHADRAMYQAKALGGDRYRLADTA